ncbi:MAG: hypothetical protein LBC09_01760, partial [Helicobacteraceae bacterium]|nr:hypothetical protein [Helicobacteraceae bacterium]
MGNVVVTELEDDVIEELNEEEAEALKLLGAAKDEKPRKIVQKIKDYAEKILSGDFTDEQINDYAIGLGSLWGKMVEKEYRWSWKSIDFQDGYGESYYIVSPKEYYCCNPIYFIQKILMKNNPGFDG